MKKVLSDGYIIRRGFRIDLLDDGYLIMNDKEFEILPPDEIKVKGKLNGRKNVVLKAYTEEPIDPITPADEIFSMGWDHWEIEKN